MKYPIFIEPNDDGTYEFFSEELEGFRGFGNSIEDTKAKAEKEMSRYLALRQEHGQYIPKIEGPAIVTILPHLSERF